MTMTTVQVNESVARDFEAVFASNLPVVRWLLSTYLGDRALIEDLAQDVFARLWQSMAAGKVAFTYTGRMPSFFRPLVRSIVFDHVAKLGNRQWLNNRPVDADGEQFDASPMALRTAAPSPETTVPQHLDVGRALAMLNPAQRRVVALRYLEDMPLTEVADLVGSTTAAVARQAARGLAKLRKAEGLPPSCTRQTREHNEARDRQAAVEAYRASVAAGKPLTYAALAARFGHKKRWAFDVLHTAGAHTERPASTSANALAQLREELTSGAYAPGQQLATEEIAARFGLSAGGNITRLLSILAAEGLVDKRDAQQPGRASYHYYATGPAPLAQVIPLRPRSAAPAATAPSMLGRAA